MSLEHTEVDKWASYELIREAIEQIEKVLKSWKLWGEVFREEFGPRLLALLWEKNREEGIQSTFPNFIPPTKEDISEFWMDQPKSSKEAVPEFIARIYKPWLGQGLNRAHLKATDPSLSRAITDWLRKHKKLPDYLDLPNAYAKHSADGYSDEEYNAYKKVVAVMNREKYRKRKAKRNLK